MHARTAAQRQVPGCLFVMTTGARAQRLAVACAVPKAGLLVAVQRPQGLGLAIGHSGGLGQQQQAAGLVRHARQRGLQQRTLRARVVDRAQRVAELAQLVGLQRLLPLGRGQLALARHQQRDDPAHGQHRAQQQRVLPQVDREAAARRHEGDVEGLHASGAGQQRHPARRPQRGHRRGQHQQQGLAGQVELAVQRQHQCEGQQPDAQRRPPPAHGAGVGRLRGVRHRSKFARRAVALRPRGRSAAKP